MNFLPSNDRQYLENRSLRFSEVEDGKQKGIILLEFGLPSGRYDVQKADILILLPSGYPDVPPDMFYLLPWAKLLEGTKYPKAANQPFSFKDQKWQRWSRHNNQWRPGVDGIWTMLKRIENALEVAA